MNLLIANENNILDLVNLGLESNTETCEIEILNRIKSKTDFYCILFYNNKPIGKCLIKKCLLTDDDDNNTYYLREVYKNKLYREFKIKNLLDFAIQNLINKQISFNLKLFVDILNLIAIQLYKHINFKIIQYDISSIKYTEEYFNDKTYNKLNLKFINKIEIYDNILLRPDRKLPFYKMEYKLN